MFYERLDKMSKSDEETYEQDKSTQAGGASLTPLQLQGIARKGEKDAGRSKSKGRISFDTHR